MTEPATETGTGVEPDLQSGDVGSTPTAAPKITINPATDEMIAKIQVIVDADDIHMGHSYVITALIARIRAEQARADKFQQQVIDLAAAILDNAP